MFLVLGKIALEFLLQERIKNTNWYGQMSSMLTVFPTRKIGGLKKGLGEIMNCNGMTVEEALADWPKLMALNLKLGSPVCVHADGDRMKAFMAKVEENGYRVDFVCVHWYGGANPESAALGNSALFDDIGNLTPIGTYYSSFK